jgi:hypothetical protein
MQVTWIQNVIVNLTKIQIDTEARAFFREEVDGSNLRLSDFVLSFIMSVAVTFHRPIKRYF